MSSAVANPGCERTAGKITRCVECCKRNFSDFLTEFSNFLRHRPIVPRNQSQHGDRVDVDRQLDAVRRRGAGRGHVFANDLERPGVRAAQLEVEPIEIADLEDRGRGRAEDADRRVGPPRETPPPGRSCRRKPPIPPARGRSAAPSGRTGARRTFPARAARSATKPSIVVPCRRADRGVVGRVGLHEHPAGPIAPPGASGHLRHELKGPLGGAEVGQMQRRVGVDHPHQRHVGEVEPLGDHLSAQQDLDLAGLERRQAPARGCRASASCPSPSAGRRRRETPCWISRSSRSVPMPP